MFDQYDVYENGMGLSGRGGGENQSTEDLATTKKYFIGAIIQGTISKEQRVREIFKFSTLPNTTHTSIKKNPTDRS